MLILRRPGFLVSGITATITLTLFWIVALAGADQIASPWLDPSVLTLQKQTDSSAVPTTLNGNTDCYIDSSSSCIVTAPYGNVSSGGLALNYSSLYLPVNSYLENRPRFIPIPNSTTVITYTTTPVYGGYVYFNYNFQSAISLKTDFGSSYYQVSKPPDGKLTDLDHHLLAADISYLSFSQNGEWMVVSEPNVAMLRINLRTFEVLPFAPGFNYSLGLQPAPQTTITNDGRYVAVASKDFSRFNIYDLSTCASQPATITGPVSCGSRNMQQYMINNVPGYQFSTNLRFINDDSLGFYSTIKQEASTKVSKYILSDSGGTIHQQDYLALGDSFISGEGVLAYLPGTDTSLNKCHVSRLSYPLLIGQLLNYGSYHSVACSGATTDDIKNVSNDYSGQVKNGDSRKEIEKSGLLPSILSNFQQGYIDQLDFVKQYQPKAITLSVGGNDIGFSSRLRACLGPGSCYDTYEDRLEFVREVNQIFPKLVDIYTKLKNANSPDSRIYVIGYPQIAKAGGDCAINVWLSKDDLDFAAQAVDYLDTVVKAAADHAGVYYVDTQDALVGHRLCEAQPGSVAVNGITRGDDIPDFLGEPFGNESYHPNDFGHLLLENKVLAVTRNLTVNMPAPDPAAGPPAEASLPILNLPRSGRQVSLTQYDDNLSDNLIYRGTAANIILDGVRHALSAASTLRAELHSTPTILGSFKTDAIGTLAAQVLIPDTTPTGYHTLHFYGTNMSGQPVDIFKTLYVAAMADDLDGNGTLDSTQPCVGLSPSGIDSDKDGVDDACDAAITLPPPSTNPQVPADSNSGTDITAVSVSTATTPKTGSFGGSSLANSPKLSADQPDNNSSSGDSSASITPTPPKVLAAATATPITKTNLRGRANFYILGAFGFIVLTTLGYLFRRL